MSPKDGVKDRAEAQARAAENVPKKTKKEKVEDDI